MTHDTRKWELEMKADRILCRISVDQLAYLGDGFPWEVSDEDIADSALVDEVRQRALELGVRARGITATEE